MSIYQKFVTAAKEGNIEVMKTLLADGAQVDMRENKDSWGTALHVAIFYRQKEAVLFLLQQKADINAITVGFPHNIYLPVGRTALELATYFDYREIAKVIADHERQRQIAVQAHNVYGGLLYKNGSPLHPRAASVSLPNKSSSDQQTVTDSEQDNINHERQEAMHAHSGYGSLHHNRGGSRNGANAAFWGAPSVSSNNQQTVTASHASAATDRNERDVSPVLPRCSKL